MRGWLRRTWRRARHESPRRALRAGAHEATASTVGRAASAVYARRRDPTPIWARDWDVCCLLDGCRLDLLRELADERGGNLGLGLTAADVDASWSVGSQSAEWMARTFAPEYAPEMERTAYVTGNPFSAQSGNQIEAVSTEPLPLAEEDFGWLYEAWRTEWIDEEISTIPPGPLTDAAIAAWRHREELGIDRVLVHYMQPHTPFRSRPDWFLGTADIDDWGRLDDSDEGDAPESGEDDEEDELDPEALDPETRELLEALDADGDVGRDPWTRLRDGELPREPFWRAYRDNLAWVLGDVARLAENCDGRIALTSDHGNGAGEFGVWSHPPAVHLPALRAVPWVTLDGEDRWIERPDLPPTAVAEDDTEDAVRQRLVDLGYR